MSRPYEQTALGADGFASLLGYRGRPARLMLVITVNGRRLYHFNADLASGHFSGAVGTPVEHLRKQAMRILRDSQLDSVEKLGVRCWANGLLVASREAHAFPRMTELQRAELVDGLSFWLSQWLSSGALPIGEATPQWQHEGRIVG